jgi:hypothetical protein
LISGFERIEVGIGRDHVIDATRFDAMTRIIDERNIGAIGILDEALDRMAQLRRGLIGSESRLEAEPGQKILDRARVASGARQGGQRLIGRLADHQGNAFERLFGRRPQGKQSEYRKQQGNEKGILYSRNIAPLIFRRHTSSWFHLFHA